MYRSLKFTMYNSNNKMELILSFTGISGDNATILDRSMSANSTRVDVFTTYCSITSILVALIHDVVDTSHVFLSVFN